MKNKLKRTFEEFKIYYRRYKGAYNKLTFQEAAKHYLKVLKLIWLKEKQLKVSKAVKSLAETYKNDILKAYYAWHNPNNSESHTFESSRSLKSEETSRDLRDEKCLNCGRTREQIRYDSLPYNCVGKDTVKNIKDTLKVESEKFFNLISRAEKDVPKIIEKRGLSGETLWFMHTSLGYTLEVVGAIVDIPESCEKEYEVFLEKDQESSRSKITKNVITCK